ncbi:hypothetical protein BGZ76_006649 [Entomortierella beljakovae]|nr:hypothetical protein BGZ76_006649 [Entomortierella beljakovae]
MRIPQFILLTSIALALVASAEKSPSAVPQAIPDADTKANPIIVDKKVETSPDGTTTSTVKAVYSGTIDPKEVSPGFFGHIFGHLIGINAEANGDNEEDFVSEMSADDNYDYITLYGDDGYFPRPLPEQPSGSPPCAKLGFLDQMVWDQQGDSGQKVPIANPNNADDIAAKVPKDVKDDEHTPSEAEGVSKPTEKDSQVKGNEDKVHSNGISLCLLGPCDNDEDEEHHNHRHRIYHKQRKFLKQFRGKALIIDDKTGCPLPFHK